MDPRSMMLFTVIMTIILASFIGGVIVLKPLFKQLGEYLGIKLEQHRGLEGRSPDDWARLLDSLDGLTQRMKDLEERQDFSERLLSKPSEEDLESGVTRRTRAPPGKRSAPERQS
jgi:hypothetical protein